MKTRCTQKRSSVSVIENVMALQNAGSNFGFYSGAVFIIENLDYESSHEYYLTIEATDGGTPSLSDVATVNINVTDVNDNTPVFSQDTYTAVISEDAVLEQSVITVCIFPHYSGNCVSSGPLQKLLVKSICFL